MMLNLLRESFIFSFFFAPSSLLAGRTQRFMTSSGSMHTNFMFGYNNPGALKLAPNNVSQRNIGVE